MIFACKVKYKLLSSFKFLLNGFSWWMVLTWIVWRCYDIGLLAWIVSATVTLKTNKNVIINRQNVHSNSEYVLICTYQWPIWQLQRCTVLWSRWTHFRHPYAIVFVHQSLRVVTQLGLVQLYRNNVQWNDHCHHEIWYKSLSSLRCTQPI